MSAATETSLLGLGAMLALRTLVWLASLPKRDASRAWLELEVHGEAGGAVIRQTAIFDSSGLSRLLYWHAVYPLHALVFRGMQRGIARQAEAEGAGR